MTTNFNKLNFNFQMSFFYGNYPKNIRYAIYLWLFSTGLALVLAIPIFFLGFPEPIPIGYILVIFAIVLWELFLFYNISKGKNWGRIVFLVFSLFGYLTYFSESSELFRENFLDDAFSVFQSTINLGILFLLFSKQCNQWFKRKKQNIIEQS